MFALVLLSCAADPAPPRFEVVNRCPPAFVVVNRVPTAPPAPDRFTAADGTTYQRGADGHYRAAPGVAAPRQPFRNGDFHASHRCPACGHQSPAGTGTWVIRGHNPDGSHSHSCERCGASWRHK